MSAFLMTIFASALVFFYLRGELEFVRDQQEIQLRQARFRLDRLERRVLELEGGATQTERPQTRPD